MIKSMTAYSRYEHRQGEILYTAEIKSLNNRYSDIIIRIPKNLQILEKDLKDLVSSKIRRGRIEVSIQTAGNDIEGSYEVELNLSLVKSYLNIFDRLSEEFGLDKKIEAVSFCQIKDVIRPKPEQIDMEELKVGYREVLIQALKSLDLMKIREGEAIMADFLKRLSLLEEYVTEVEKRSPDLLKEHRDKMRENVNKILGETPVDEIRLTQEVAFFAGKSDITEEIVRIKSHLGQFHDYLSLDDAIGRRLDFLVQEINREVNTFGSKASDFHISKIAVEMKSELEKLREQIQNIE